jgi:hypothetical protein
MTEEQSEEKPKHKLTYAERWLAKKTPKTSGFFKNTSYNKHVHAPRRKDKDE